MNSATLPTMDFPANLSHWTAWIDAVSVVAVAVGVVKAFDWLDGLISDKSRVALWYYMADVPSDSTIDSWGDVFPNLIDKVFGKRALSWAFIFRSCLASLVACVCLSLAFIVAGAYNNIRLGDDSLVDVLIYFVMGLIYTLVGDYFSLLISRAVLHQMAGLRKFPDIMSLAILDLVLTVTLVCFSTELFFITFLKLEYGPHTSLSAIKLRHPNSHTMLPVPEGFFPYMPFVLSAFFASAWVWLYILSILFIKLAHKIRPLWIKLIPYLDIERKPMQAVGRIAGVVTAAGWTLILGIIWARHFWH